MMTLPMFMLANRVDKERQNESLNTFESFNLDLGGKAH